MVETAVNTFNKRVEELTGIGTLMQGDTVLLNVTYHLRVYQTFYQASRDAQPTPGVRNVQEKISFSNDARHSDLEGQDLTLGLDDGKRLNLQLGPGGRIYTRGDLY
jgi:hypothetical protein